MKYTYILTYYLLLKEVFIVMKKFLLSVVVALVCFASCKEDDEVVLVSVDTSAFTILPPNGTEIVSLDEARLTFKEMKSLRETVVLWGEEVKLAEGLYDCSYEAKAVLKDEHSEFEADIYGKYPDFIVSVDLPALFETEVATYIRPKNNDFLIEEIYCAGTPNAKGTAYVADTYMKVFNNSDDVLYADRLALVETMFTGDTYFDYIPNPRGTKVNLRVLYVIPGSGTDYPINPGQSFIICSQAQDHSLINGEGSINLSDADFEIFDESSSSSLDIDNPSVPNAEKWYSSLAATAAWTFTTQGNRSIAIARIPESETIESYALYEPYEYSYVNTGKTMTRTAYWIPNDWIIDGVNMCPMDKWKWNIFPASIDAGYTYSNETNTNRAQLGLSVIRKSLDSSEGGLRKLQDTNDSSADFLTAQTPTLLSK